MSLVTNCRLTQLSGKQKSIKVILGSQTDFFKARAGKTTGVEVPITDNQEEDFLRMCFFTRQIRNINSHRNESNAIS